MGAFKAAIVGLLAVNTGYFAIAGTAAEAVDAAAWLALLILFELETAYAHRLRLPGRRLAVRAARLAAGLAVISAAIGYLYEGSRLDALNSALWIAVVLLLELQVRYPQFAARMRMAFSVTAAGLYGTLGVLVLVWAGRGEWFDAYDAALWLTAFATLELNTLKGTRAI